MIFKRFVSRRLVSAMLLVIALLPHSSIITAQSTQRVTCKPFDTTFRHLGAGWHWLTPDQLVFLVSDGLSPRDLGDSPDQWYQYQPSSDKLEKLAASPFQTAQVPPDKLAKLKDLQPDRIGNYVGIQSSKSGDKFVYLRKMDTETVYWFIDTKTGAEANLGRAKDRLEVFWLPDENQFIIQDGANTITATLWVSQDGQKITTKRLDSLPDINRYRDSGLVVSGISPSGHYLLITPESPELWLYDIDKQQITKLDLVVVGNRRAAWVGANTFRLLTTQGVIEYDIPNAQLRILAKSDELNLDFLSEDSISPDRRYLLYHRWNQKGIDRGGELGTCVLP
jgi:hypothetical protein